MTTPEDEALDQGAWLVYWWSLADPACKKCEGRGYHNDVHVSDRGPGEFRLTLTAQTSACPCTGGAEEH